jgi:hypothetical protein
MTTFKHPRGKTYRYDFRWTPPGPTTSIRYQGLTGQLTKEDADRVESQIKIRVVSTNHVLPTTDYHLPTR